MIVEKLLRELDAELERLQTARATIAALVAPVRKTRATIASSSIKETTTKETTRADVLVLEAEASPEPPVELPSPVKIQVIPPRRRGRPKGSRNRFPPTQRTSAARAQEPTALTRAITTGPVFVSAAELDRQRKQPVVMAAPRAAEPTPSEGTLEALVRELTARRVEAAA